MTPKHLVPAIAGEILPDYTAQYNFNLDKLDFLKAAQYDTCVRLPTVHIRIDPRFPEYLHQLYYIYPITDAA